MNRTLDDGEEEVDWEDEMANHADEYLELPEMDEDAFANHCKGIHRDNLPEDWIERSNRLAAQDEDG